MQEHQRNTVVGAFMIVGLAAMAWLMTSFGELPALFGKGEYHLIIVVKEPSGVKQGDPIFLNGLQIGRVKELQFKDPDHLDAGVEIIGAIQKEYSVPDTATAYVQPSAFGLSSGRIDLRVQEGVDAPPLPEGEAIPGEMASVWGEMIPDTLLDSLDKTIVQFGEFVGALTPVADDLHVLFEKQTVDQVDHPSSDARRLTANLSTVIERFDQTLKTFNETFGDAEVRAAWFDLVANVRQMGADGSAAMEDLRVTTAALREDVKRISLKLEGGIDDATLAVNDIANELRPALENIAKLAASLMHIANAIESGEGTAGRLVNDPRAYESLVLAFNRLTDLIDTMQRVMSRFERRGAIGLDLKSGVGSVPYNVPIPPAE
jgi:phospholipid/cholesterol/gamma-HCH transport system substrate-binding protein